jgi:RNA polymerase primary sigma factor
MTSNLKMIERRPRPVRSGHQFCAPTVASVAATNEIDRRPRLGVAPAPDGELGLAISSGARHVAEMRARRMSEAEARIRFVGHPDFDDPTATAEILGPMPGPVRRGRGPGKARARKVLPVSDADLQDSKFLTREQEFHLFRKMNFLKYQAAQLHEAINPGRALSADLDRVEELLREADAIRNRIVRSYIGLVIFNVTKWAGGCQDFSDLISAGNVAVLLASEQFDFARGTRFSTYATQVIFNDFARRIPRERIRSVRFATGHEVQLQALADHRDGGRSDAINHEHSRSMIRKMVGYLDGREQMIIVRRFGLAGETQTLEQVGRELGISKERIRQLQRRALEKLRTLAKVQKLDPTDESA